MIKKLVSGILAFTMVCSMVAIPNSVLVSDNTVTALNIIDKVYESGNYSICSKNGDIYIKNYLGHESDVVIPARFNDNILPDDINLKDVTIIAESAFQQKTSINSIVIPDTVKEIQKNAFTKCINLKTIIIPASVTKIGENILDEGAAVKIICEKDSAAETYAKNNGIEFHVHGYTSKVTKQPSCTEDGIKTYTCECGDTYTEKVPAAGHNFGAWTTTKAATCTAAGTQERKCSLCGKVETKTILAKGHSYKAVTVKSTYFAKGYTAKKCSTCGAVTSKKETAMLTMAAPKSTSSASSVKLSWSKVSGAKGYVVYQKKSGKWTKIKTTTATSYTVSKLPSGTTYQFCIKPYTKSGSKTVYGNTSKTLTTFTNPATVSFKLTAGSKKATVKWSKVTGASGYKIYYKTSKNGSWKSLKTVNNKTTSYTKTGLTKGKTYYFTVKAYRTTGGKTYNGGYAAKSVKIK